MSSIAYPEDVIFSVGRRAQPKSNTSYSNTQNTGPKPHGNSNKKLHHNPSHPPTTPTTAPSLPKPSSRHNDESGRAIDRIHPTLSPLQPRIFSTDRRKYMHDGQTVPSPRSCRAAQRTIRFGDSAIFIFPTPCDAIAVTRGHLEWSRWSLGPWSRLLARAKLHRHATHAFRRKHATQCWFHHLLHACRPRPPPRWGHFYLHAGRHPPPQLHCHRLDPADRWWLLIS